MECNVCTGIVGKDFEDELRMLFALHDIGVIVLDSSNPSESEIVVPARARQDVDWQSVHRLVEENEDMREWSPPTTKPAAYGHKTGISVNPSLASLIPPPDN